MTKEEMLNAIYDEMADKTLSVGCYFLGRYGLFESQVMKHKLREVKKELVIVRDFFHSYEDIAELYLVESHNEFFLAKGETLIDERMYSKIRNKYMSREGNFSKHHKIDKIIGHPVLIGNILKYIDTNCCFVDDGEGHKSRDMKALNHMLHSLFYNFVGKQDRPIDEQDELCIEFVYNLIKK